MVVRLSALRTGRLYPQEMLLAKNLVFSSTKSHVLPTRCIYVWISEQTAIISLYSINWLVFITETEYVYCSVRSGSLHRVQTKLHYKVTFTLFSSRQRQSLRITCHFVLVTSCTSNVCAGMPTHTHTTHLRWLATLQPRTKPSRL